MLTMTQARRAEIVAQARALVQRRWPRPPGDESPGECVFAAAAMMVCARRHGYNFVPQAGSMQWPMVASEHDDGESATHFSYMWEPGHPLSVAARAAGRLPEMHVWLGDPVTHEIVDITTRDLPRSARLSGYPNWTAPLPPDFLWARKLPEGVGYAPNREATIFAASKMKEALR